MPNQTMCQQPESAEMDLKAELKRAKVNLHNAKIQIELQQAIVEKFEKLISRS